MDLTTSTAGVAALLLQACRGDAADSANPARSAAIRRLRTAASADVRSLLDRCVVDSTDGEQVLCLVDLLLAQASGDEDFRRRVVRAGSTRPAAAALGELAADCRRHGSWGAAAWCEERAVELAGTFHRRGREAAAVVPDAAGGADSGDVTHEVTRRLAELHAESRPGAEPSLDEDEAFDLVSTVLHGARHGDVAIATLEQAAAALVDDAQLA